MINTKSLLVLALAALSSLTDARPVRGLKEKQVDPPQSLSVTRHKGVHARASGLKGAPDEVDMNAVIFTCEKGDEACKDLEDAGEKVSQEEFGKSLAEDMMGMLEGESDGEKKNEDDRRELYTCYWYYYCDCCYCYYRYACY